MYWNPAAVANQDGFNSENHAAAIIGDTEITVTGGNVSAANRGVIGQYREACTGVVWL